MCASCLLYYALRRVLSYLENVEFLGGFGGYNWRRFLRVLFTDGWVLVLRSEEQAEMGSVVGKNSLPSVWGACRAVHA